MLIDTPFFITPMYQRNSVKFLEIVNAHRYCPLPQLVIVFGMNLFSSVSVALVKFK